MEILYAPILVWIAIQKKRKKEKRMGIFCIILMV